MSTSRLPDAPGLRRAVLVGDRPRWLAVVAVQAAVLAAYLALQDAAVTAPRYLVYPFVWLNASAAAVLYADPTPGSGRHAALAGVLAAGYFTAILWVAGFLGPGTAAMTGWRIIAAPPGWGPMLAYQGALVRVYVVPFQVAGYAALAYLLYAAALDATRGAAAGVLGLVSCVGCTWTALAGLLAGAGGASAFSAAVYALSYDLTTVVFLTTLGLLYASQR